MERITMKLEDGSYVASDGSIVETDQGYVGPAVDRLAAFENAFELLQTRVDELTEKIDALKAQNKIRSAQGQQLVAQKISYSSMFNLFDV